MELTIRICDTIITAKRGLQEEAIHEGEKVDVFVYRLFVTAGDKAYQLENNSLKEDSMVI